MIECHHGNWNLFIPREEAARIQSSWIPSSHNSRALTVLPGNILWYSAASSFKLTSHLFSRSWCRGRRPPRRGWWGPPSTRVWKPGSGGLGTQWRPLWPQGPDPPGLVSRHPECGGRVLGQPPEAATWQPPPGGGPQVPADILSDASAPRLAPEAAAAQAQWGHWSPALQSLYFWQQPHHEWCKSQSRLLYKQTSMNITCP